jgi:tRNA dimethylallyltransferase
MSNFPKIIAIVGPTASGKSDLAVEIALKWNGEILSADSRQVYTGLDIISGKITAIEMKGIPHHLLDVTEPNETFDVIQYKERADRVIKDILARGKVPILCGGTGFYIDAVVTNSILPTAPPNKELRIELEQCTTENLFERLKILDPKRAEVIDSKNPRRLVRAIEIATALGRVPAERREPRYQALMIGIKTDPKILRARIEARLMARFDAGMIDEAKLLHEQGLSFARMDSLGLECRYLAQFLQQQITYEQMIERLQFEIWHYAKRQLAWFSHNKKIHWFGLNEKVAIDEMMHQFLC